MKPMQPKKLDQTRLHTGEEPTQRGNCYPAVIASVMGLDSAEDAIQIQEYYDSDMWHYILWEWLQHQGWELTTINGHLFDGSYYLASGMTIRGTRHVCIYRNGYLWHDPHPSRTGLLFSDHFETIEKIS